MALALDAPPEVRHEAWNALLRSHLQHCTMSAQLHRHGLQAPGQGPGPWPLRGLRQLGLAPVAMEVPTSQPSARTVAKAKVFEKGSARSVQRGLFGLGGRFLPKDLTTLEDLDVSYVTKAAWVSTEMSVDTLRRCCWA